MSSIFSPNFQFTFSQFDKVTYVTGSYGLTPRSTECKHLLKDSAFNSLQDRICLQNSLGGGEQTHSQPSVYDVFLCFCHFFLWCGTWLYRFLIFAFFLAVDMSCSVELSINSFSETWGLADAINS